MTLFFQFDLTRHKYIETSDAIQVCVLQSQTYALLATSGQA